MKNFNYRVLVLILTGTAALALAIGIGRFTYTPILPFMLEELNITKINDRNAEVSLDEIETGISPGQACVFYVKNKMGYKVLGGGWIDKAINNYLST